MTTQTIEIDFQQFLETLQRLTAILSTEIQMIKEMKISDLDTLQEEKLKLLTIIENFKGIINENPDILGGINKETRAELQKANDKFEELIEEDGKQLIKAKKIHGIVMESIRKVLEDNRKKTMVYDGKGAIGEAKKNLTSIPFTVDSKI